MKTVYFLRSLEDVSVLLYCCFFTHFTWHVFKYSYVLPTLDISVFLVIAIICCNRTELNSLGNSSVVRVTYHVKYKKHRVIYTFTFMLLCIVIDFFLNNQPDALIIQIYSVIKLYMFRASSLPIIRRSLLYIRHW